MVMVLQMQGFVKCSHLFISKVLIVYPRSEVGLKCGVSSRVFGLEPDDNSDTHNGEVEAIESSHGPCAVEW